MVGGSSREVLNFIDPDLMGFYFTSGEILNGFFIQKKKILSGFKILPCTTVLFMKLILRERRNLLV